MNEADDFTLDVCEELFGNFLQQAGMDGGDYAYECGVCEKTIPIKSWVTAPHKPDCIINRVREVLAKHRPHLVPGFEAARTGGTNAG